MPKIDVPLDIILFNSWKRIVSQNHSPSFIYEAKETKNAMADWIIVDAFLTITCKYNI